MLAERSPDRHQVLKRDPPPSQMEVKGLGNTVEISSCSGLHLHSHPVYACFCSVASCSRGISPKLPCGTECWRRAIPALGSGPLGSSCVAH